MKILAIDDNRDNIITYNALISHLLPDCKVYTAMNGKDGIEKAKREQPDTILLDVKMPEMDGYEACKILKTNEETKHIPIIMITAIRTDPESRIKGFKAGADSFIGKPIDEGELAAQINVMLRIKKAEDKLRQEKKNLETLVEEITQEVIENQIRMQILIDNIPGIVYRCEIHPPWRMQYISKEVENITGYKPQEFIDRKINWKDIILPEDNSIVYDAIQEALGLGKEFDIVYRIIKRNGEILWVHEKGRSTIKKNHNDPVLDGVIFDITETRKAQKELELKSKHLTSLFDNPSGYILYRTRLDRNTGKINVVHVSPSFAKVLGIREEDKFDFEKWFTHVHSQDLPEVLAANEAGIKPPYKFEQIFRYDHPELGIRWLEVRATGMPYEDTEIIEYANGIILDITEQKKAEQKLKNSLKEKEVLLAEIHHRVKNNLQVISSLISMQSRAIKDEDSLNKFRNTEYRIRTMSMIHQKLYQEGDFEKINFKIYIGSLTDFLMNAYKISKLNIDLILNIDESIELNINKSIPMALILNELFSNSLKYAFPDGQNGKINITMQKEKGKLNFQYKDNGVGIEKSKINKESLGMSLIEILAAQLEANVNLEITDGIRYQLIFKG
ncbi:MAG: PAS domain-containing protein [Candidatus Cloacimonetes bacterium]|nr:PAS domain-containing protein [Candidatus Cloacimonadota bacterium]MCF7815307.1 PAS domain-containing protein [Candidatus Cloacimonadota bacterium]MCF7869421.1 PAS domain-containing protein [Candidatus Cloacimonadota bacterium]MCF7884820.1 PAS domain-containing protein [Candidatus Cloacimonadota bacterium]